MSEEIDLAGSVAEWIGALPPYQQETMTALLQDSDELQAIATWIDSTGPDQTAPLGAFRAGATLFLDKVLIEIHTFLCSSDTTYTTDRGQLLERAQAGKASVIALITTAVAPQVGAAAVLLAPPVAIILAIAGRASRSATCEVLETMIRDRNSRSDLNRDSTDS